MMHAAPDSVRTDLIAGQNYVRTFPWADLDMMTSGRASLFRTIKEASGGTGVLGDASLATAEKGSRITEAVLEHLTEIVRTIRSEPASLLRAAE